MLRSTGGLLIAAVRSGCNASAPLPPWLSLGGAARSVGDRVGADAVVPRLGMRRSSGGVSRRLTSSRGGSSGGSNASQWPQTRMDNGTNAPLTTLAGHKAADGRLGVGGRDNARAPGSQPKQLTFLINQMCREVGDMLELVENPQP